MVSVTADWLEANGLSQLVAVFEANEIDIDAARDLTENDLRELGIAMGPRKKLLRAIAALNDEQTSGRKDAVGTAEPPQPESTIPPGERRQVAILFADISGYTRLTGEMDAEETHSMLSTYFRVADGIVKGFGGTVDKHIGDSVMAVFGAPTAYGNDAARAVQAAEAIHQAMPQVSQEIGRKIEVHIGVASGEVVASSVGSENSYTVTGNSVNLASRLTDKAGPCQTFLSAEVQQSIGPACDAESLGLESLKGIAEPVHILRFVGFNAHAAAEESRPFVGRQSEQQQFRAVLQSAAAEKSGHVVYVRGEAGIGKTRLSEEFEKLAVEQGYGAERALILDFGAGKGQDAIRSLVRSLLGIPPPFAKNDRVAGARKAIAEECITEQQTAFLYDLLDIEPPGQWQALYNAMDNARRNEGKRDVVAALVRFAAAQKPLLMIIEDVHWAEEIVLQHLASLARAVADIPALLVLTSRIEGDKLDANWRTATAATPLMTIDLRPLRPDDALSLASEFFDVAQQFAKSCVERADGNPLFLEQLLRGAEAANQDAVPPSVQSIVQARMDALSPADKQALQAASVLGQRFSIEPLRHLTGISQYSCGELIERFLVRRDGERFLFTHALIRDGVYKSLLNSTRKSYHLGAGEWYRQRDAVLCAEHLDLAGDPGAGAAFLAAAHSQAEALHFDEVIKLTRRGAALPTDSHTKCGLNCALGEALLNTGDMEEAVAAYRTATEIADSDQNVCKAWIGLASAYRIADQQPEALKALEPAAEAAWRSDLTEEQAQIHYLRGNLYFPLGRIDECLREHSRSHELATEVGSIVPQARSLSGLGDGHYLQGRMITACQNFRDCVTLAQQNGLGRIEVENRHMIGWTRMHLMEFRQAVEDGRATAEMASQISNRRSEILGLLLIGTVLNKLGDTEDAVSALKRCESLARRIGAGNFLTQCLTELARATRDLGDVEKARAYVAESVEVSRGLGKTFYGPTVLGAFSMLAESDAERLEALDEADQIFGTGCVAHNYPWFSELALDDALDRQEWERARRYADRLESYTRSEPLPWSTFMVERARALADWYELGPTDALRDRLGALREQAGRSDLVSAMSAITEAIGE
ncbi:MAG: adenylate/guanylate cyclase domain-containing protein [Pseudomonadota bacterium]